MSRQIQIRRGTAAENNAFIGAIGEVTMDTTNKTLRVHDGETAGGTTLAKQSEIPDLTNADYVIESQTPTATNNYTWYRKYKSGWVEQGGILTGITSSYSEKSIPVAMADTNYTLICNTCEQFSGSQYSVVSISSTTAFKAKYSGSATARICWRVSGMAAA